MTTQLGISALEALERAGLTVHATDGDHEHIGKRRRMTVRIDVSSNEALGRTIALTVAGATAIRQLPLTDIQAEAIIHELRANATFHPGDHVARILEHLLLRVGHIAEELDLRTLVLDPVSLAEGGYCIDAAALTYHRAPTHHGIEYHFRQGRDNVLESPRYHERR
jgi:hypothetical protein